MYGVAQFEANVCTQLSVHSLHRCEVINGLDHLCTCIVITLNFKVPKLSASLPCQVLYFGGHRPYRSQSVFLHLPVSISTLLLLHLLHSPSTAGSV